MNSNIISNNNLFNYHLTTSIIVPKIFYILNLIPYWKYIFIFSFRRKKQTKLWIQNERSDKNG